MSSEDNEYVFFSRYLTHHDRKFEIHVCDFQNEKQARKCIALMTECIMQWDYLKARKNYALMTLSTSEFLYRDDEIFKDIDDECDKCVQKALTPKTRISNDDALCSIDIDKSSYFELSVEYGRMMLQDPYWKLASSRHITVQGKHDVPRSSGKFDPGLVATPVY